MNKKQLAWILTAATLIVGLINTWTGQPAFLNTLTGLLGLAAIIVWVMIWWKKRQSQPKAAAHPQPVQVIFLNDSDLDDPPAYTYLWALPTPPSLGSVVEVPARGETARATIVFVGASPESEGMQLKYVTRIITDQELEQEAFERAQALDAWFDHARATAGLPTGDLKPFPSGYPTIPPVSGTADRATADEYGRGWWKIYKRAEEEHLEQEAIDAFHTTAKGWFAIRDRA